MGKLRNIEQVTDQFAHHLAGIILAVIGKRQFFIMLKELLTHIPFHVGTHHMALIADIIFAQALDHVHQEQSDADPWEGMQDHAFILSEKCFGGCPQNLRIGKVYKADDGCAEQVNKKDHFIGAVVMNEFFECMHKKFLSS